MAEIIFSAPDESVLASEAARLGFMGTNGKIVVAGPLPDGGSWFLNIVGNLPQAVGYWGRLRLAGEPENMPHFSSAITQYGYSFELDGWTADGVTLAPKWVGNVGLIA